MSKPLSGKKSGRNVPRRQDLLAYLEKGERAVVVSSDRREKPGEGGSRCPVRKDGSLVIPPAAAKRLGRVPGSVADIRFDRGRLEVLPDIHSLGRVYVEPASRCGLSCRTCLRNTWNEPTGDMDPEVFDRLVSQLGRFPAVGSVMFGDIGEPMLHPAIIPMVRKVKSLGLRAEMVTNGTRLDGTELTALWSSGLDMLWVSLDGATEESYRDVRGDADFGLIVENLRRLNRLNARGPHRVELGIAFVLLRRNLADLKNLDKLARIVGARRVLVSHVLPYSPEMEKEMLCLQTLTLDTFTAAPGKTEIDLPRLDVNSMTKDALFSLQCP